MEAASLDKDQTLLDLETLKNIRFQTYLDQNQFKVKEKAQNPKKSKILKKKSIHRKDKQWLYQKEKNQAYNQRLLSES